MCKKKTYALDKERLCFLSEFSSKNGKITNYSIDIEAADDSHYEIKVSQLPALAGSLGVTPDTEGLVVGLTRFYERNSPYSIRDFLENHSIKFEQFHFY
jgi:hypothetical protein